MTQPSAFSVLPARRVRSRASVRACLRGAALREGVHSREVGRVCVRYRILSAGCGCGNGTFHRARELHSLVYSFRFRRGSVHLRHHGRQAAEHRRECCGTCSAVRAEQPAQRSQKAAGKVFWFNCTEYCQGIWGNLQNLHSQCEKVAQTLEKSPQNSV